MHFGINGKIGEVQIGDIDYSRLGASQDGNCLFHSAGHGLDILNKLGDNQKSHAALRAFVVAHVEDNAKKNTPLGIKLREGLGASGPDRFPLNEQQISYIDGRIAYLKKSRSWGDEACLTAIENLYDVEVLVYDETGSLQSPDAIRYYAPSQAKPAKLRLCMCFIGYRPVHFDLFVPDYLEARDKPAAAIVGEAGPINKAKGARQVEGEPWAYHLNPAGLELFAPDVGHRQFYYSGLCVEEKPIVVQSSGKKMAAVALGKGRVNTLDGPAAPVVAVVLRNLSKSEGNENNETTSFSATAKPDPLVAHHEHYFLPLQRVENQSINLFDLSNSEITIEVDNEKGIRQPVIFYLRVYQRSRGKHPELVKNVEKNGLIFESVLEPAKIKECREVSLSGPARQSYTFPLTAAFSDKSAELLDWTHSPYQLVVSSHEGFPHSESAWTHFHAPSEWDVNVAERFAGERVIMLGDSLTPLGPLGARVNPLANTALENEASKGRESFDIPEAKFTSLKALSQAVGLGEINTNTISYFAECDDGYYALTSWATMIYLQLNKKDDRYYAHSYYCTSNRSLLRATAEVLGRNDAALAGVTTRLNEWYNQLGRIRLDFVRGDYANLKPKANCQLAQAVVDELTAAYKSPPPNTFKDVVNASGCSKLLFDLQFKAINNAIYKESGSMLSRDTVNGAQISVFQTDLDNLRKKIPEGIFRATQKDVIITPTQTLNGVIDFEKVGGKTPEGVGVEWNQYVFEEPILINHAVTVGISSCAGGVTFSTEEVPEHLFMWHLDASLSIPILPEMQRLWPDPKDIPEFRTLALITPSPWELNKYRPDNLYPPEVLGKCGTVYMGRGAHWYHESATIVAGCDLYGVDVSKAGQADLVFTYDTEKRAPELNPWRELKATDADAPGTLTHFTQNLYGTVRHDGKVPKNVTEMAEYSNVTNNTVREAVEVVKRFKRENVNKSCRVPGINHQVFKVFYEGAKPLIETDAVFAFEKGDPELAHRETPRWTPGSIELPAKKKI